MPLTTQIKFQVNDFVMIDGTDYILVERVPSARYEAKDSFFFLIRENKIMTKEECISEQMLYKLYEEGRLKKHR